MWEMQRSAWKDPLRQNEAHRGFRVCLSDCAIQRDSLPANLLVIVGDLIT